MDTPQVAEPQPDNTRVLVAEDNPISRELMTAWIELAGYDVGMPFHDDRRFIDIAEAEFVMMSIFHPAANAFVRQADEVTSILNA